MSLIEVRGVSKSFTRGGRSFEAVSEADLRLEAGEFLYITGRSGSGKTTLLNLVAGFLEPDRGELFFDGADMRGWADDARSVYRNRDIGYVPQQLGTMPNLTVVENVALPACLFGGAAERQEALQRAAALLDWMGILKLRDELPRALSGGELKRVLLARALMNEPRVLLADEPTADLDGKTTAEVMELLARIHKKGTALVIVTHEEEILKYGDRVLTMREGRLLHAECGGALGNENKRGSL